MDASRARQFLEKRRESLQTLVRVATEQGSLDEEQRETSELSATDQHPADAATDTVDREMGFSIRETAEENLKAVDRALERVDSGSYGVCAVCNAPIAEDRLEARPEAEYCVAHQPKPLSG
jgi:RNA polymerase-binding protein DksA